MTIEELEQKHTEVWWETDEESIVKDQIKLSIQFAIEILEELINKSGWDTPNNLIDKIEELKNIYNGKY